MKCGALHSIRAVRLRAFSLVELLTVIAILAVLASFILPSFARAKAQTRAVVCKSNLRQLGLGIRMYVGDYGFYPMHVSHATSFTLSMIPRGDELRTWTITLQPYVKPQLLHCTEKTFIRAVLARDGTTTNFHVFGGYGYNAHGTGAEHWEQGLGLGAAQVYADKVVAVKTSDSAIVAPSAMLAMADAALTTSFGPVRNMPAEARHLNNVNVLHCDGHVNREAPDTLAEETTEARRRWNKDNEPHPETW